MSSSHNKSRVIGLGFVLFGLVVTIIVSFSSFISERHTAKRTALGGVLEHTLPSTGEGSPSELSAYQKLQQRRAEEFRKRTEVQPPRPEDQPGFKSMISEERRDALYRITGKIEVPNLVVIGDRRTYSREEILQMYPFLIDQNGTVDESRVDQLQKLLEARIAATQRMRFITNETERIKFLQTEITGKDSPSGKMTAILRSYNRPPTRIVPTDTLSGVSKGFEQLDVSEMTEFLRMLSIAQSNLDKGKPAEDSRMLVRGAIPSKIHYAMPDDVADFLLRTPLEQLAVGQFEQAR